MPDNAPLHWRTALKSDPVDLYFTTSRKFISNGLRRAYGYAHNGTLVLPGSSEERLSKVILDVLAHGFGADGLMADRRRLYAYCADSSDEDWGIWAELPEESILSFILSMDGLPFGGGKAGAVKKLGLSYSKACGIYNCLVKNKRVQSLGFFDEPVQGLALKDTVVCAVGSELRQVPHAPGHRLRTKLPFPYAPGREPVEFLTILQRTFAGDIDADAKVELIRQFIGASLMGIATTYDLCLVFLGSGANGKSTVIDIICSLFPPDSVSAITPQTMHKEYYLMQLDGKLLNTTTEMPSGAILASDKFKAVVSGDRVMGRDPHKKPVIFNPKAGHVFAANELPKTEDHSQGFWRRVGILEFNQNFVGQDSHMSRKDLLDLVRNERPAVIAWALEGASALLKAGKFILPASHQKAIGSWQQSSSSLLDWKMGYDTIPPPPLKFPAVIRATWSKGSDLYNQYKVWCSSHRVQPINSNKFANELESLGLRKEKLDDANYWNLKLAESTGGARKEPPAAQLPDKLD